MRISDCGHSGAPVSSPAFRAAGLPAGKLSREEQENLTVINAKNM
jgi:hypothetical protein